MCNYYPRMLSEQDENHVQFRLTATITEMGGNKNLLHVPELPVSVLVTQTFNYYVCTYKTTINVSKYLSYFSIAEISHHGQSN